MKKKKRICVFIGSRSNYNSSKAVMRQLRDSDNFELLVMVAASAVLDRFGNVSRLIKKDGFDIHSQVHLIIEGETPTTMAKSTGLCIIEAATVFENLKPDMVLVVGDRFEVMGIAIAASYMNIPLIHTMGGEISGSIDESIRHAITKLSHIHFPATKKSAERILRMGENKEHVHFVGCPRIDEVKKILVEENDLTKLEDVIMHKGVGAQFSLSDPFIMLLQHPVTTEYGHGREQIMKTLEVIDELAMNTIMFWPNIDAGSDDVARGIRIFREEGRLKNVRFFKNLSMDIFICLMDRCECVIGNSSSAIREGAFIGVPAVNIGTRQQGRERGKNIIDVEYSSDSIRAGIEQALKMKKGDRDTLYGDGTAAKRIVDILRTYDSMRIQKKYIDIKDQKVEKSAFELERRM